MTKVYKFGGASIATPERMRALLPIIKAVQQSLVVVVSAYGKTTNALEEIVSSLLNNDKEQALKQAQRIEQAHLDYAKKVLSELKLADCELKLQYFLTELYKAIDGAEHRHSGYIYDQIVSIGELLSTTIFAAFLQDNQLPTVWQDARELICTDDCYKDAKVDESVTHSRINAIVLPILSDKKVMVTQGFIGCSVHNTTTTLGREGSDYSGALLAAMISATSIVIWKDVEGLLNADPRQFSNTRKIPEITFHEVIEMAYYGAQVIHPKTIKPLQNAGIPLWVKCFFDPEIKGTLIHQTKENIQYPPLIVLKENQTLLQITSRDFSFITEDNLSYLYRVFHQSRIKINLIQNTAISVVFVVNHSRDKVLSLIETLENDFKILRNDHQSLLTIRHYTSEILEQLTQDKTIILTQKTRQTAQMVFE